MFTAPRFSAPFKSHFVSLLNWDLSLATSNPVVLVVWPEKVNGMLYSKGSVIVTLLPVHLFQHYVTLGYRSPTRSTQCFTALSHTLPSISLIFWRKCFLVASRLGVSSFPKRKRGCCS